MISTDDKKYFIWWFLKYHELKTRESEWILKYIVSDETLLSHTHFVRHADACPRGLIISSRCSPEEPFRFYKKHIVTTDTEKAFHDIRINWNEPLYIQLSFKNAHKNALYAGILTDHPFLSKDDFITYEDQKNAEQILDKSFYDFKRKKLTDQINSALDRYDKKEFDSLVKQLYVLEASYKKGQPI